MAGDPLFYCLFKGKTDGGENDRLDAGAYPGSRRRLRHSISAVGPETPSTKKRPLSDSDLSPPRQEFALNLSAKRRLCTTVGGRFIDGNARCCAVSTARSRAATMTNFARSNQSWVSRALFGAAKGCPLVNLFMICPPVGWWLADHDQILPLNQGHLMAQGSHFWDFGLYCRPAGGWGPPDHIR
jgi:hypothetical protein